MPRFGSESTERGGRDIRHLLNPDYPLTDAYLGNTVGVKVTSAVALFDNATKLRIISPARAKSPIGSLKLERSSNSGSIQLVIARDPLRVRVVAGPVVVVYQPKG